MRHLNHDDRIIIETLYTEGYSNKDIAAKLGVHISTIYREIKRGLYLHQGHEYTFDLRYSADIAQKDYDYKSTSKGAQLKLSHDFRFVQFCEACILRLHWSPGSIIGFIRNHNLHFDCKVCTKTLYNYIDMGLFFHVSNKDLPEKSIRKKRPYRSVKPRKIKLNCRSIDERPAAAAGREEFGHWEMDTVKGRRDSSPCLLVFTERLTRYEIILKLQSRTQIEVQKALNRLEMSVKGFSDIFKTITVDNGSEFLNESCIELSCLGGRRSFVYYCHPYSSFERGSNENANKLIRRFIPKGTPIENYSDEDISKIQNWINRLPRKLLNYCSSSDFVNLYNSSLP